MDNTPPGCSAPLHMCKPHFARATRPPLHTYTPIHVRTPLPRVQSRPTRAHRRMEPSCTSLYPCPVPHRGTAARLGWVGGFPDGGGGGCSFAGGDVPIPHPPPRQSEEPEGRSYSTLSTVREIETQTEVPVAPLLPAPAGKDPKEEEEDGGSGGGGGGGVIGGDDPIKQAMTHFVQENGMLQAKPTTNGIYINGRGHLV